jgi:hypothetical protein
MIGPSKPGEEVEILDPEEQREVDNYLHKKDIKCISLISNSNSHFQPIKKIKTLLKRNWFLKKQEEKQ